MTDLPDPLTPPDCDLRDFQFMPMDIVRLFGSRFHAVATDAEWRAGITLWLKSFHQVPAASVPDDDIELARLAELGRDLKTWKKIRAGAMHGWVKCSDGRLYHPVVAEKAEEAFKKKEFYRDRSKKANAKRWGRVDSRDEYADHEGQSKDDGFHPKGNDQAILQASNKDTLKDSLSPPSASQGTVKRQKEEESLKPPVPNPREGPSPDFLAIMEAAEFVMPPPDFAMVAEWKAQGADMKHDILPIMRQVCADAKRSGRKMPFKLKYFNELILAKVAADNAEIARLKKISDGIDRMDSDQRAEMNGQTVAKSGNR